MTEEKSLYERTIANCRYRVYKLHYSEKGKQRSKAVIVLMDEVLEVTIQFTDYADRLCYIKMENMSVHQGDESKLYCVCQFLN